jgi:hypothetical protein
MSEPGRPFLRVVRGQPRDEETAALTVAVAAVLAARARAGRQDRTGAPGNWASHARALRVPPAPAPQAWRRSALPG